MGAVADLAGLDRDPRRSPGDHQTGQLVASLLVTGFVIQRQVRTRAGIIQRIIAVRPAKR